MRILLINRVYETSRDLAGISEWNLNLEIMRAAEKANLPLYFYLAVPRPSEKITWDPETFNLSNTKVLEYDFPGYYGLTSEMSNWFRADWNSVNFDVVWNALWWHNTTIAVLLQHGMTGDSPWVVNSFYESPRAPELRAHSGVPLVDLMAAGGAIQDRTVVLNEYHRDLFMEIGRLYLSASMFREMARRVELMLPAIGFDDIASMRPRFEEQRANRKELVVYIAGGLSEAKRKFEEIAATVKRVSDMGYPVKLRVRTQADEGHPRGEKLRELGAEISFNSYKADHLAGLGEADVVVDATTDEGTGLTNLEAMASGMPCIAMRQKWMKGRFPSDYPLFIDNFTGLENMLVALSTRKDLVRKYGYETARFIGETYDGAVIARRMIDIVEGLRVEKQYRISRSIMELIEQTVNGLDRVTLSELYTGMSKFYESKTMDWSRGRKYWNGFLARRAMEQLGFTDTCESDEPVFVRVADDSA